MMSGWLAYLRELMAQHARPAPERWTPTVDPIPVGRRQMLEVYGDPDPRVVNGKLVCDPRWERNNCHTVSASLIAGYDRRIYMHSLVAPHFVEAMRRAVKACPGYQFKSIGCFNCRRQRYDTPERAQRENRKLRPWSDHTSAIAFDINRDTNHWAPSSLEPWSRGWREYSDLPRGVVEAFESCGFEWGGRWTGKGRGKTRDTVHFSLRRTS